MFCKSFLFFYFVILTIVSFSTGLAYPTPISTFSAGSNIRLMGRVVTYFNHSDAAAPSLPASIFLDDLPITRAERFHNRLTHSYQRMIGMASHTAADE